MNEHKLRTAVIGLGRIGWLYHTAKIFDHDNFELSAVVDPLPERLAEAERKFSRIKAYGNMDDMFRELPLDLVVIASPTLFHKDQILQAFANNCDVFCDKPLAVSLEEVEQIISAMKKSRRKLMVYQPHRITPLAYSANEILKSGKLGKIFLIKRAMTLFDHRNDWQAFRKYGGGVLINHGAHIIDQLLYLCNTTVTEVFCELRSIATAGDAEDCVKAVIKTAKDITFDLDINLAAALPVAEMQIFGENGAALYGNDGMWTIKYYDPATTFPISAQNSLAASNRSYFSGEDISWQTEELAPDKPANCFYDKCFEYFGKNKPPFVPIEQTYEVMRTITMLYEHSRTPETCN